MNYENTLQAVIPGTLSVDNIIRSRGSGVATCICKDNLLNNTSSCVKRVDQGPEPGPKPASRGRQSK